MTFIIWGVSTVMTVNVEVAPATHEAPFSPRGRRVGEEGESWAHAPSPANDSGVQAGMRTASERGTVMTFMIWGLSTGHDR
jgi:hypothetical protein